MNEFILVILKNIGTFSLTMFGVEMTVFTVVYSFIVSKRSYFKAIAYEAKLQKMTSTHLETEKKFAINYIDNLKRLNVYVVLLAIISLILYFVSLFFSADQLTNTTITLGGYILAVISFGYILCTVSLLIIYLVYYVRETKIRFF